MADPKPTSERLQALQARWESDKGSRVFLQLADEYRRLGREEDAVQILDEGLEANPGHVGARVARGRSLLALGRAREATTELERVIEADPTQMVAYRFLVEGYIQQRDADQARQRLRVYGLLNDADPDIEELDRKIRELERAERTGAWPMPGEGPGEAPEESGTESEPPAPDGQEAPPEETSRQPPRESAAGDDLFPALSAGPSGSTEEAPLGDLSAPSPEPEPGSIRPAAARPSAPSAVDPFPALTVPEDRRRYAASFEEDLFAGGGDAAWREKRTGGGPESGASDDPFDLATPAAKAPDFGALGDKAPDSGALGDKAPDFGALGDKAPEEGERKPFTLPGLEPGRAAAAEPPPPFDLERPPATPDAPPPPPGAGSAPAPEVPVDAAAFEVEPAPEAEPGTVAEPAPAAVPEPEAAAAPEPPPAAGSEMEPAAESAPEPAPEPEPEPAAQPAPAAEQGRGTVTLGRLYLRQGHLQEAEESFREVLERDPGNEEALRGLEEVASRRAPDLDVADLLTGYAPSEHGEGLTARKRYALARYLVRLRGGGADVH